MKSKKGFTLIELLAVIVILAIIALIAVPVVLNIIERAREGAAKSSGIAFVKATETYLAVSQLDKNMKEEDKLKKNTEYKVNNIKHLIQIKGDKPSGGEIKIGSKNEVVSARLIINGYVVKYDGKDYKLIGKAENIPETYTSISFAESAVEVEADDTIALNPILAPDDVMDGTITWTSSDESKATVDKNGVVTGVAKGTSTITAKLKNNKMASITVNVKSGLIREIVPGATHKGIVYLDPTNLDKKCTKSQAESNLNSNGTPTEVKTGCMKWYIYDDSGDNYIMILDHNTTAQVNYRYRNEAFNKLVSASGWKIQPREMHRSEILKIAQDDSYLDGSVRSSDQKSEYYWLFDNLNGCLQYGCRKEDNNSYKIYGENTTDVLDEWGTDFTGGNGGNYREVVTHKGHHEFVYWWGDTYHEGVRPVIEVPKSQVIG